MDLADLSNYDIILDTSNLTAREAAKKLIEEVIKFKGREEKSNSTTNRNEVEEELR